MGANPHSRSNPAEQAEKQVQAYTLRLRGLSLREIGKQLGVSHETARKLISAEADDRVLPLADELRKQQLDRLNDLRLKALTVLEREHVHIAEGRVVRDKDPVTGDYSGPIIDDGPVLSAIDRLLKIEDRMARLFGLDAPSQQEIVATMEHKNPEVLSLIEQARQQVATDEAKLRSNN